MNKDLQIAKKTVQTEIEALKKLSVSFNKSSQNHNTYSRSIINLHKTQGGFGASLCPVAKTINLVK